MSSFDTNHEQLNGTADQQSANLIGLQSQPSYWDPEDALHYDFDYELPEQSSFSSQSSSCQVSAANSVLPVTPSDMIVENSIWQMQPSSQHLTAAIPCETNTNSMPTSSSQNSLEALTLLANAAADCKTAPTIQNSLPAIQPKYPLTTKPKLKNNPVRTRKTPNVRVVCKCPNCILEDGNKTVDRSKRLLHVCHIPGCGQEFKWPSKLQVHLRKHQNERPYDCDTCEKSFKSKEELVRHTKIHTGEKNFSCPHPLCDWTFKRSDHLDSHVKGVHEHSILATSQKVRRRK